MPETHETSVTPVTPTIPEPPAASAPLTIRCSATPHRTPQPLSALPQSCCGLHGGPRATRLRIVRRHARVGAHLHRRRRAAVHRAPAEADQPSATQVSHRRRRHVHRVRSVDFAVDRPGHHERAIRGSQPRQLPVADVAGADDGRRIAQTWCRRQSDSGRDRSHYRRGDGGRRRKP